MKTTLVSIVLIFAVVACGKPDKQAELVKLKKQHDQISEQIKKIENELASDTTNGLEKKGIRVAITEATQTSFIHCIEVQGKVDGDESVNVFAEGAGGMIQQVYAKDGQYVNKGQILAILDDKIYQSQLKSNQATLDYVTTMYEKQKALWDQKIGSEVQYLDIKSKKESLENAVAAIKEQIDMCKIKAPISGSVEDIAVKVGQLVGPGVIAFRVVNLSSLKIVADIAEGYSSKINQGDIVKVTLPDLKRELNGKIDFNSRYINPTNRTFSINVRIPSGDKDIKANMVAVLKITDYHNPKAIAVPINVLQNDQRGQFLVIADKNVAKKVRVTTGEIYKGLVEIKTGLNSGDKIITSGFQELENGQAINF